MFSQSVDNESKFGSAAPWERPSYVMFKTGGVTETSRRVRPSEPRGAIYTVDTTSGTCRVRSVWVRLASTTVEGDPVKLARRVFTATFHHA
eukprot:jgi/Botrbrau1/12602/Bobra.0169s0130.1